MSDIPLLTHLLERLDLEKQLRDERWRHHDEKHELEAQALRLQAIEYERRLDQLNHDHANTRLTQQTYVSIGVYDAEKREWDNRVRNLEKWQNNLIGRLVVIGALAMVVAGILGAVIARKL